MNWKEIKDKPLEQYGWFAVAVLPRNHSGSDMGYKEDLKGDNSWRKSYGFSKAWLNNGEWYEPSHTGSRNNNITRLVTHWDYLPEVPELKEPFYHTGNERFNEKPDKEFFRELAMKHWEEDQKTNPKPVNPEAYNYGFITAVRGFLGLK